MTENTQFNLLWLRLAQIQSLIEGEQHGALDSKVLEMSVGINVVQAGVSISVAGKAAKSKKPWAINTLKDMHENGRTQFELTPDFLSAVEQKGIPFKEIDSDTYTDSILAQLLASLGNV